MVTGSLMSQIRRIKEKEASLIRMEEKNKYLKEISKNKEKVWKGGRKGGVRGERE